MKPAACADSGIGVAEWLFADGWPRSHDAQTVAFAAQLLKPLYEQSAFGVAHHPDDRSPSGVKATAPHLDFTAKSSTPQELHRQPAQGACAATSSRLKVTDSHPPVAKGGVALLESIFQTPRGNVFLKLGPPWSLR
jgi:hypothetical protein